MTHEQEKVLLVKEAIASLPPEQLRACTDLADHLRQTCRLVGNPVGVLALALIGAEAQLEAFPVGVASGE